MSKYLLLTLRRSEVTMLGTYPYQGNAACIKGTDAACSQFMAALTLIIAWSE
jgi:hypothetical protein